MKGMEWRRWRRWSSVATCGILAAILGEVIAASASLVSTTGRVASEWEKHTQKCRRLCWNDYVRDNQNYITGHVMDVEGVPVSGATVALFDALELQSAVNEALHRQTWPLARPWCKTQTDDVGEYTIIAPPYGAKVLTFAREGYRSANTGCFPHYDGTPSVVNQELLEQEDWGLSPTEEREWLGGEKTSYVLLPLVWGEAPKLPREGISGSIVIPGSLIGPGGEVRIMVNKEEPPVNGEPRPGTSLQWTEWVARRIVCGTAVFPALGMDVGASKGVFSLSVKGGARRGIPIEVIRTAPGAGGSSRDSNGGKSPSAKDTEHASVGIAMSPHGGVWKDPKRSSWLPDCQEVGAMYSDVLAALAASADNEGNLAVGRQLPEYNRREEGPDVGVLVTVQSVLPFTAFSMLSEYGRASGVTSGRCVCHLKLHAGAWTVSGAVGPAEMSLPEGIWVWRGRPNVAKIAMAGVTKEIVCMACGFAVSEYGVPMPRQTIVAIDAEGVRVDGAVSTEDGFFRMARLRCNETYRIVWLADANADKAIVGANVKGCGVIRQDLVAGLNSGVGNRESVHPITEEEMR